jgi:hypothetical protein
MKLLRSVIAMVATLFGMMFLIVLPFYNRPHLNGPAESTELVQANERIKQLEEQLKKQPIGRKIGQIEFKLGAYKVLMDEYVMGDQVNDWPSVACTPIAGDRNHRKDRSLELAGQHIWPITTIDLPELRK